MRPARPHCAQEEREPDGSPSSCESPPPPSGRAARVKVSDAFRLPPNCHCGRQGIGCHPRRVRLHGSRPGRRLHGNGKHKPYIASTPTSRVRRKTELPRHYRKSNFSTVCGKICLRSRAAAYIPSGGDPQEGARPPLARPRRAGAPSPPPAGGETLPVRHGHTLRPAGRNPSTKEQNPFENPCPQACGGADRCADLL